jgi:hypothetical protein
MGPRAEKKEKKLDEANRDFRPLGVGKVKMSSFLFVFSFYPLIIEHENHVCIVFNKKKLAFFLVYILKNLMFM